MDYNVMPWLKSAQTAHMRVNILFPENHFRRFMLKTLPHTREDWRMINWDEYWQMWNFICCVFLRGLGDKAMLLRWAAERDKNIPVVDSTHVLAFVAKFLNVPSRIKELKIVELH